ncbi:MAG TPA: hypothetical protein VF637_17835 [Sphingomicrobium sp.]
MRQAFPGRATFDPRADHSQTTIPFDLEAVGDWFVGHANLPLAALKLRLRLKSTCRGPHAQDKAREVPKQNGANDNESSCRAVTILIETERHGAPPCFY